MKKRSFAAGLCFVLFLLLIVVVKTVDVAAIGPENTSVGLSKLNGAVHALTGVHMALYEITDWLGYLAILVALVFAGTGLVQWIRRRSLRRVDQEILALACLYIVTVCLYVLFEVLIVNRRPVLMPGESVPEASFPSSHTMLVCVIMGSTIMLLGKYVRSPGLCRTLQAACAVILVVTFAGRLVSGVHWFTDILGGILISLSLLLAFSAAIGKGAHSRT